MVLKMNEPHYSLEEYMRFPYAVRISTDECGEEVCYMAVNPELDGCMAQGDTPSEAVRNLEDARQSYIAAAIKRGLPIPLPKMMAVNGTAESFSVSLNVPPFSIETVQTRVERSRMSSIPQRSVPA